jgi:hypothetical protein
MSPLMFLGLAALVFVVVAGGALYLQRERHSSFESGIERFRREMHVLAPEKRPRPPRDQDE